MNSQLKKILTFSKQSYIINASIALSFLLCDYTMNIVFEITFLVTLKHDNSLSDQVLTRTR